MQRKTQVTFHLLLSRIRNYQDIRTRVARFKLMLNILS